MDRGDVEAAEVLDGDIGADDAVRRAATIEVDAATLAWVEARLDRELPAIAGFFGTPLTGREGVNFLRYAPGGFYLPHVDRAEVEAWPNAARRRTAIVVFLNTSTPEPGLGEFSGGELHVIDARAHIVPVAGRLVAFDAGLLHEVTPVRLGTRDVIVDWCY
jgi:predicted 2-oxoglutarate/Fe(II)-dependent dioxygenase YbiX